MRLKTRISVSMIMVMLAATAAVSVIIFYSIASRKEAVIDHIRGFEKERTRKELYNTLEVGFNILEQNYLSTSNRSLLIRTYGNPLRNLVNSATAMLRTELAAAGNYSDEDIVVAFDTIKNRLPTDGAVLWLADTETGKLLTSSCEVFPFNTTVLASVLPPDKLREMEFHVFLNAQLPRIAYAGTPPGLNFIVAAGMTENAIIALAQENSKEQIRNIVFDEGQRYVFAFNSECVNILHPYLPHLENTDFSYVQDTRGRRLVSEMINLALKQDEGFITYYWPKPRRNKPDIPSMPKLTYVKVFKPWMWILATGVYTDSFDEMVKDKIQHVEETTDIHIRKTVWGSVTVILLLAVFSVYLAGRISNPLENLEKYLHQVGAGSTPPGEIRISGAREIVRISHICRKLMQEADAAERKNITAAELLEKAESELSIAHEIQTEIIPQLFTRLPEDPRFEPYIINYPASDSGGAMYDIRMIDSRRLCIAAGDISRSGLPAALYGIVIRTMIHSAGAAAENAGTMLNEINNLFSSGYRLNTFIRIFIGIIDLESGEISYVNAGHSLPSIIRNLKDIEELPPVHGEPLGMQHGINYLSDKGQLVPGDILCVCSEGFMSLFGGEGQSAVGNAVSLNLRNTGANTMFNVDKYIADMIEKQQFRQDVTVLAIEYHGKKEQLKNG